MHGRELPGHLNLLRVELDAGRATQATLLGEMAATYESLYLSPALVHDTDSEIAVEARTLQTDDDDSLGRNLSRKYTKDTGWPHKLLNVRSDTHKLQVGSPVYTVNCRNLH